MQERALCLKVFCIQFIDGFEGGTGASNLTFPALDLEVAGNITVYKSVLTTEIFTTGPPNSATIVAALRLAALGISLSSGVQVFLRGLSVVAGFCLSPRCKHP